MSTGITPLPRKRRQAADVPTEPIYRFSVAQYHQMIDAGILSEDDPVELLDGWLVPKMPKNPRHSRARRLMAKALERLIAEGWFVDSQEPLTTARSEPEPDVVVVRADPDDYAERHPGPRDLALVVEVADSSLKRDRGFKKQVYARARVPVYWILNLVDRQLEVYTEPVGRGTRATYNQHKDYGPNAKVSVVIDGREVGKLAVRDVLP